MLSACGPYMSVSSLSFSLHLSGLPLHRQRRSSPATRGWEEPPPTPIGTTAAVGPCSLGPAPPQWWRRQRRAAPPRGQWPGTLAAPPRAVPDPALPYSTTPADRFPRASSPKCHHNGLALLSAELYRHPKSATVGEAPRRFPWREASSWPRQPLRCLTPAGQAPELQFADERRLPVRHSHPHQGHHRGA